MNQIFVIAIASQFMLSALAASFASEVVIDWSRVKPITHYPDFWKGRSTQPPKRFFENVSNYKKVETYVSNGNVAGRHDFPYKVALISEMSYGSALCGASLISRWAVLTAASCIYGASSSVIVLGASNIQNPQEPFQARFRVQSTNFRIHQFYRDGVTNSDVGIVRFNHAIHVFTQAVNMIRLPTPAMMSDLFANQEAVSMGFGRISNTAESYSYNLQFVVLTTMTNLACSLRFPGRIDNSHICTTGILRRGFCDGDVGAPLVLERAGNSYQIGIASFFPESGCMTGEPSIFTRITNFIAFIEQHM
jgi:secreted trypsin-like serine protease